MPGRAERPRNRVQVTKYNDAVSRLPQLNFPPFNFRVTARGENMHIWDACRRVWLVLTPEEWVRQHMVMFLVEVCGIERAMVRHECPVCIEGTRQRADIVVYGRDARPLLLVECKAHDVDINAAVFSQVVRYNAVLAARYIAVTNGIKHFIHERGSDGRYTPLQKFPDFNI